MKQYVFYTSWPAALHIASTVGRTAALICFRKEEEAKRGRGRVYVSGRGAPLYVTHFLYHIPRLYCISSDVVWHQQLLAVNSHFISMLTGEKQTVQEMKRCSDCLSDYCC